MKCITLTLFVFAPSRLCARSFGLARAAKQAMRQERVSICLILSQFCLNVSHLCLNLSHFCLTFVSICLTFGALNLRFLREKRQAAPSKRNFLHSSGHVSHPS